MNRFNEYMANHFRSCRVIARAHDECRDRSVTIHAMPGFYDVVGVTDGTDAWVAPASAGLFFKTATGDCADLMRRLKAGEPLPPVPALKEAAITTEVPPCENLAPRRPRARLEVPQQQEEQPARRQRVRL